MAEDISPLVSIKITYIPVHCLQIFTVSYIFYGCISPYYHLTPSSFPCATMTRPFKPPPLARDTTGFRCNSLRAYAWKQWTMFEATFAICGLEPWEKLVFVIVMSLLTFLFFTGLSRVIPSQLISLLPRTAYYLWGDERVLNHWMDHAAASVREL